MTDTKKTPRTQYERSKTYTKAQKHRGYVSMRVWVKPEERGPIRQFIREMRGTSE